MTRYALIIGISQYSSVSLPPLSKATTDAERVAQVLEKYGAFQEVKRLPARWEQSKECYEVVAKPLNSAELGQTLRQFLLKQAARNEALIYFAGHGITVSDNLGQQKGYLATSDCIVEIEDKQIVDQKRAIALDSLNELIAQSELSSLIVILDCCHSGYFLERGLIEQTLTAFSYQRDYYFIAACRDFEKAYEDEEHGVFTSALLKGLSIENSSQDGYVSGDRLFDYISRELRGSGQEPIRMGWGRSIALVSYRIESIEAAPASFNHENPYQGLYAFAMEQENYFCGRERAIRALIDRLTNNRFLAVIGPSGCGKSSLVKAGLLPQIRRDRFPGSRQWTIETFTPGKHPLELLLEILARQRQHQQPFVLFIDQLEEIFTLCEDEAERQSFIRLMADEATNSERFTRVIVAIRGDYLDRCAAYPEAAALINRTRPTTYVVTPLSLQEILEAIEKPAALHGATFEPGLALQIAQAVEGQPGALPLLQYSLKELWRVGIEESSSPQPYLTKNAYEETGGVKGALEKRANDLYRSFTPFDQAFVRRLFMELVQLGEGQEVTRRRVSWQRLVATADSPEQLQRVIRLLAGQQQRLIITDEKTVEVAHEALLSEWTLLQGWIEEDRESIRLARQLEAESREWQTRFQKSDEALLMGARLAAIAEWVEKTNPKLTDLEEEYLQKSLAKREQEIQAQLEQERQLREEAEARALAEVEKALEAEARAKAEAKEAEAARGKTKAQKQKTRIAIGAAVALTALAVLTFGFGIQAKQRKSTAIEALVSEPQRLLETNNQLEALMASVTALKQLEEIGGNNTEALKQLQSVINRVRERNRLQGHQHPVLRVSFSPDGNIIASASYDGTVKLWSKRGELRYTLRDPNQNMLTDQQRIVFDVEFRPDGEMLASAHFDETVKFWDIEGNLIRTLGKVNTGDFDPTKVFYSVSFSPDNQTIAAGRGDGSITLWNSRNDQSIKTLRDPNVENVSNVYGIDFNPINENILASTGYDGSVKIWNLQDETPEPEILGNHENIVTLVRFSPNGEMLASSSYDGRIKLWERHEEESYSLIKTIPTHGDYVNGLAFSPDGEMIASASRDKSIKLWELDAISNGPQAIIRGHEEEVNGVSFSPNERDQIIATSSSDNTVRIWSVDFDTDISPKLDDLLLNSCNFLRDYLATRENDICQIKK